MRLLFLTDNFFPENNAPASRGFHNARFWSQAGAEVTVITSFPNSPSGILHKGYKNKLYSIEYLEGIRIIRVWTYITANQGFIRRTLDYFSFGVSSFIIGLFISTDLILATSPQFFTPVSASFLSYCKRVKWVFEVRDLWPESIVAVGAIKLNYVIKILEFIELRLYKSASQVIVVSPAFKTKITRRGLSEGKISFHPNGVDDNIFNKENILKNRFDFEKDSMVFTIGYIGTIGMAHDLMTFIKTFLKISDSIGPCKLLIIGEGALKNNLAEFLKESECKNIHLRDPVPRALVPTVLSFCDVALVHLKESKTFEDVIPSKIFDAVGMNIPILSNVKGVSQELLEQYNAGINFDSKEPKTLINAIRRLNSDEYLKFKEGSRLLAQDYSRKNISKQILKTLNNQIK